MYVACPTCRVVYQISAEHLRAAGGKVRCGQCSAVFTAPGAVFETADDALNFVRSSESAGGLVREIDDLVDRALGQIDDQDSPHDGVRPETETLTEDATEARADSHVDTGLPHDVPQACRPAADRDYYANPVAAEIQFEKTESVYLDTDDRLFLDSIHHGGEDTPGVSSRAWWAIAASFVLMAVLAGQYLFFDRDRLSRHAELRPVLEWMCSYAGCTLPMQRDLSRVEVTEREVRDHPRVGDALLINATFVNRADFVQPFPVFRVSFSDVSGITVAARQFSPLEYLGEVNGVEKGMQPGDETRVKLEIVDPGARAVSFQFDFL